MGSGDSFSIRRLEELAALALDEHQRRRIQEQLQRIVQWWEALDEFDLPRGMVDEMSKEHCMPGGWDEIEEPLGSECALQPAPEREGDFFSTPPPFGEEPSA